MPSGLNEFKLFLFIMLANADHRLALSEVNQLFEKLDEETFISNLPNNELLVARVYKAWHGMSPQNRLDFVKQQLRRFYLSVNDLNGARDLLSHLHEIVMADGIKSEEELQLIQEIENSLSVD